MARNVFSGGIPTFRPQGPSANVRLALCVALAVFLVVADVRFKLTEPLRKAVATVLFPLQWVMLQPVLLAQGGAKYFEDLHTAQAAAVTAEKNAIALTHRANLVETLDHENQRLRQLLNLVPRLKTEGRAAQVVYETADAFNRRVVIDKGEVAGIARGSPVMDEMGVLGQVTRVFPMSAEVTLLTDREQAIPVLNPRTGARAVAYGDPTNAYGGGMELRFMPSNADIQEGDLLTTSGVDGVYAPGLPVARIVKIERRADSPFSRVYCEPLAQMFGTQFVMVINPLPEDALPPRPPAETKTQEGPASTPARASADDAGSDEPNPRNAAMIMPRGQPLLLPVPPGFVALTLVLALMINMLPLGRALWLPDVLLLVLVYWGVHEPGKIGMGWAFVLGLCMDVHQSSLLGLHALVYSGVLYGVALLRQRITWLSVMAQAVQVMPLFLASDVVLMLLRLLLRGSFPGWGFLTPGLWCVLLWPLVSWLLQLPQRQPPDDDENRPL